jgi:spore coat polysaccharide biosynthesis protein SpsF
VTLYVYRHVDQFSIGSVRSDHDWSYFRWTVDTEQDLQLVREIYRYFGTTKFNWRDVVQAYAANPDWIEINRNSIQKVA